MCVPGAAAALRHGCTVRESSTACCCCVGLWLRADKLQQPHPPRATPCRAYPSLSRFYPSPLHKTLALRALSCYRRKSSVRESRARPDAAHSPACPQPPTTVRGACPASSSPTAQSQSHRSSPPPPEVRLVFLFSQRSSLSSHFSPHRALASTADLTIAAERRPRTSTLDAPPPRASAALSPPPHPSSFNCHNPGPADADTPRTLLLRADCLSALCYLLACSDTPPLSTP